MSTIEANNYQRIEEPLEPEPQKTSYQEPEATFDFDTVEDKHASTPIYELGYN